MFILLWGIWMIYGTIYLTCLMVSVILIIKIYKYKESELGIYLMLITIMNGFWMFLEGACFLTDHVQ